MFEFYEFNTTNCISVLILTFISYYIIYNYFDHNVKKDKQLNFEYLFISILISIGISLIIAYFITYNEEKILNDNYWDPILEKK